MSAEPLASVVVPSYNHSAYLPAALASVEHQTYRRLEIVVIDDASTDTSPQVLAEWARRPSTADRFERVVYERNPTNAGAHNTLNAAVSQCRGETVFLLNSDDLFHRERVTRVQEAMAGRELALGFGRVRYVDERGEPAATAESLTNDRDVDWILTNLPSIGFGFLHRQWAVSTGNLAFTPDLFARLGGFSDLAFCHDWDFLLRACLIVEPTFVDEELYDYRVHPSNTFATLGAVAERETQAVIARYLNASLGKVDNPLAPVPANWPGVFELVTQRLASHGILEARRQVLPRYVNRVRTP